MSRYISYGETPTTTSVWIADRRLPTVVFAHSDGVNWLAKHSYASKLPQAEDLGCERYRASSSSMLPEVERLVKWAEGLKLQFGEERSQPRPETDPLDSDTVGATTVVCAGMTRKVGEYAPAKIKEIVLKAVRLCVETWGWAPETIRVSLHPAGTSAVGRAYQCGKLDSTKTRRISLSRVLFSKYDAQAIHRVVVHELCHHYREERFPPSRIDSHDARFCSELSRVDPIVAANPKSCTFFEEQVDETVVAAVAKKKEAGVVWSPDAGTLVMSRLKSGWIRYDWTPVAPGMWKGRIGDKIHDESFVALLQRFAPSQWKDVRVSGYPDRSVWTLADLVNFYMRRVPERVPKTAAYLKTLA